MDYKNLRFVKIDNLDNYKLFENGDIINIKLNKKISVQFNKYQYLLKIHVDKKVYSFNFLRLMYEKFYNEKLTSSDIIRLKNDNAENKFHYENLEKINRKDMVKIENHDELDNTKEWKIVKNYPEYKISNCGDIFSIKSNKMLKPTLDLNGYFNVKLINNLGRKGMLLHRIVYDTFKNIEDNDKVIDHIDRNKINNNINNLREVSLSDNSKNCEKKKCEKTKIHQYSLNGEFIKEWDSFDEIKSKLGYNNSSISSCYTGKLKTAYGFIWKNPKIIVNLDEFVEINTRDNNKFSNYKINKKGVIINKNNIILKPHIKSGYDTIQLVNDDGKTQKFCVHKIVGQTFLKNPNNYNIVNHKDQNKLNNDIKNLEWVNHKQNITHSQGKKVNQLDINSNKIIKTFDSVCDAFRELNKNYGANIRWACEGKRKSAFGFKWEFVN